MRRPLRLEARVSLAVGCTLALTLVAVALGVLLRVHDQAASSERASIERESALAAVALAAGATRLPAGEPRVAVFLPGRRLGARVLPWPLPACGVPRGKAPPRRAP